MTDIVTQFKDIADFEDLQKTIGHEIASVFLARLKEFGVPDDRLRQVSEDICYDIASAMQMIGDFEMPSAAPPKPSAALPKPSAAPPKPSAAPPKPSAAPPKPTPERRADAQSFREEKTDEVAPPERRADARSFREEKTDEIAQPEQSTDEQSFREEKTDEIELPEENTDVHAFLEELNDEIDLMSTDSDNQPPRPVKGVMSQEEVVRLLNEANAAF